MERRNSKKGKDSVNPTAPLFSGGSDMGSFQNVQDKPKFSPYQERMIESARTKAESCLRLGRAFQDAELPILGDYFLDMARILPEFIDKQIEAAKKLPKVE